MTTYHRARIGGTIESFAHCILQTTCPVHDRLNECVERACKRSTNLQNVQTNSPTCDIDIRMVAGRVELDGGCGIGVVRWEGDGHFESEARIYLLAMSTMD